MDDSAPGRVTSGVVSSTRNHMRFEAQERKFSSTLITMLLVRFAVAFQKY